MGAYTHRQVDHIFGTNLGKNTHTFVTRWRRRSIRAHKSWSHFYDKFWKIHTYICNTVGKWEHTHTQKLVTFLGQILEKTHIHLSHGGDVGAYTPTKVGHIFGTNFGKYTHAFVTRLGRRNIHTHKSWSHVWDKFWKIPTCSEHKRFC